MIATRGLQKGVDFEGGTIVIVKFDTPKRIDEVRTAITNGVSGGGDAVVQDYGPAGSGTRADSRAADRSGDAAAS